MGIKYLLAGLLLLVTGIAHNVLGAVLMKKTVASISLALLTEG